MKSILNKISITAITLLSAFLFSCQEDVRELRDSDPWIVYVSDNNGSVGIYGINPITKEKLLIDEVASENTTIRYDPSKDRIIFPIESNTQIEMLTDGKVDLFLSPNRSIPPSWSVNGKIIYGKEAESSGDLFIAGIDGENERKLTNDAAIERYPVWSPTGEKAVYAKQVGNGWDLFIIDISTREETRLTELEDYIANPSWSPDGEKIAFETKYENQKDIVVFNFSTEEINRITNRPAGDIKPSWAPDSFTILFSSNQDDWDIWTADIETKELKKWTEEKGFDGGAIFVPYSSIKDIIQ